MLRYKKRTKRPIKCPDGCGEMIDPEWPHICPWIAPWSDPMKLTLATVEQVVSDYRQWRKSENKKSFTPLLQKFLSTSTPRDVYNMIATACPELANASSLLHIPHPPHANETVLEEAQRLTHGDRHDAYGHPIHDLTRTGDMATAMIRHKLKPGERLEPEDIAMIMIAVKLSREVNQPKRDNRVDGPGYFEVLDMIRQWREAHPDEDPRLHY